MSLVPPTLRQSRNTDRPVLALYHALKPTENSWRIASLWGVMMTSVSSASAGEACLGRRMNGTATMTTRARMMIPRLSMGALVCQDDHVFGADARDELLRARAPDELRVQLKNLE